MINNMWWLKVMWKCGEFCAAYCAFVWYLSVWKVIVGERTGIFIIVIACICLLQKKQYNREATSYYQKVLSLPLNWRNQGWCAMEHIFLVSPFPPLLLELISSCSCLNRYADRTVFSDVASDEATQKIKQKVLGNHSVNSASFKGIFQKSWEHSCKNAVAILPKQIPGGTTGYCRNTFVWTRTCSNGYVNIQLLIASEILLAVSFKV